LDRSVVSGAAVAAAQSPPPAIRFFVEREKPG
jgi:hypothetical protein